MSRDRLLDAVALRQWSRAVGALEQAPPVLDMSTVRVSRSVLSVGFRPQQGKDPQMSDRGYGNDYVVVSGGGGGGGGSGYIPERSFETVTASPGIPYYFTVGRGVLHPKMSIPICERHGEMGRVPTRYLWRCQDPNCWSEVTEEAMARLNYPKQVIVR